MERNRGRGVAEQITLKVLFHGMVPGLAEHRLSLGAFAEPLANLLKALRRIANTRVTEALGRNASDVGRLPEPVRQLDIELARIAEGSSGFDGLITFQTSTGETLPLFDIADRSATELLEAIDQESRGNLRNAQVRTYLKSVPQGVTRQTYVLLRGEEVVKTVEFGTPDLAAEVFGLPYLMEFVGRVTGVGFEPGRNQIRFRLEEGQDITVGATSQHVDFALENRADPIRALIVASEIKKLLWIQLETENPTRLNTETFLFARWEKLLRRLANETDKR